MKEAFRLQSLAAILNIENHNSGLVIIDALFLCSWLHPYENTPFVDLRAKELHNDDGALSITIDLNGH